MDDPYLSTVYRVVAYVTDTDMDLLHPDSRFYDHVRCEDEFYDIYEETCAAHDVPLAGIFNSMPVYRQRVGDWTLNSWRNLAPFSPRAAALLAQHDPRLEDETMASLAATLRKGVYVSSGLYRPSLNPPRSRFYVIAWIGGLYAAAVLLPAFMTLLPCNPLCSDCTLSPWTQMREMLPVSLGLATLMNAAALLPGLIAMRTARSRKPSLADLRAAKAASVQHPPNRDVAR